jgi:hypothetical protein
MKETLAMIIARSFLFNRISFYPAIIEFWHISFPGKIPSSSQSNHNTQNQVSYYQYSFVHSTINKRSKL